MSNNKIPFVSFCSKYKVMSQRAKTSGGWWCLGGSHEACNYERTQYNSKLINEKSAASAQHPTVFEALWEYVYFIFFTLSSKMHLKRGQSPGGHGYWLDDFVKGEIWGVVCVSAVIDATVATTISRTVSSDLTRDTWDWNVLVMFAVVLRQAAVYAACQVRLRTLAL